MSRNDVITRHDQLKEAKRKLYYHRIMFQRYTDIIDSIESLIERIEAVPYVSETTVKTLKIDLQYWVAAQRKHRNKANEYFAEIQRLENYMYD